MATIAFIGLGNMGSGMAANLVKAGHDVKAFDLSDAAVAQAVEQGASAAGSAADAVSGADAVVTMLPAGKHVRAVYEDQVFPSAAPGTLFLDCSTIDVDSARHVGGAAVDKGFKFVDAPVSGGVAAATGGTLTFMVGGSAGDFAAAEPFLQAMGKAVIHAGDTGAGQAAKICNNMLLAITMIGTCEAFALADKLGLDQQKFFDISSKASGQSWSMTSYCPVPGPVPTTPANNDYQPGFATAMMLKDLRLAQDAAQSAGASTPLGAQAEALYAMFDNLGGRDKDFSGIYELLIGSWGKN
ncbi:MAG: 3-hydroxyisobutyrate dehydrogenase [Maricaulis sp.]|uniref:3-hydroxyisobutyrate dehydrogenase n=1 Tax=Maricaulis sp. TaxID=1486257 RepID=UPI002607FB56|nr:3-hydroxyisobutyrate dehydrogenase [Maricaulis sp.]MDM7983001.1 3-hydroxyisobutyrate dehydrogenase [Maricaulis sp.]